jgi:hypothetical protein
MRKWLAVAVLLIFSGCGTDNFSGTPSYSAGLNPYITGPVSPIGGYTIPPTGTPISPLLPSGYSSQFSPFAPFYNYTQSYGYSNYWNNLWSAWQGYAPSLGYSPYQFQPFWYVFVPQVVDPTFYAWFTSNVYTQSGPSFCGCLD